MSNAHRSMSYIFKFTATAMLGIAALAASGAARAGCEAEIQRFCTGWNGWHMNFSIPECTRLFNSEFAKGRTAAQTQTYEWLRSEVNDAEFQHFVRQDTKDSPVGIGSYASEMMNCAATLKDNQSANLNEGRRARAEQGAAQEERSRQAYDNLPKGSMASVKELERKRREDASTTPSRQPAPCDGCGVK